MYGIGDAIPITTRRQNIALPVAGLQKLKKKSR
jgi:hypothetical protein